MSDSNFLKQPGLFKSDGAGEFRLICGYMMPRGVCELAPHGDDMHLRRFTCENADGSEEHALIYYIAE